MTDSPGSWLPAVWTCQSEPEPGEPQEGIKCFSIILLQVASILYLETVILPLFVSSFNAVNIINIHRILLVDFKQVQVGALLQSVADFCVLT